MKTLKKRTNQAHVIFKKNQSSFKLVSCLMYFIFTVSMLQGQACIEAVNSSVQGIIAGTGTANAIYSSYSSTGNSTWATSSWTGQVDFSGVAFDDSRTATLISPRHILMAQHYQRNVGSTVVFHGNDGVIHTATLIAKQSIPGGLNPDITVGLLDVDVPVTYYKVLPPQTNWGSSLQSALVVSTHHTRNASIREVFSTSGLRIVFRQSSVVPTSYYAPAVSGNSGNPSFLLINGEPVLISTFTYGGGGSGPFFSEPSNFNAINSIMTSLGGGYQLETKTCTSIVLPVELISFEALKENKSIKLTWSTASETNNDRFEIEKSYDGLRYDKIGQVNGMGTTNQRKDYQFTDDFPYWGTNYYRLKQVDSDGSYKYSVIQAVKIDSKRQDHFLVYPNPATTEIMLLGENEEIETISIYGIDGTFKENLRIINNSRIDVSFLESGTYLLKIRALNGNYFWTRLIKN